LPKLNAISGPLQGATFAWRNEDVNIGRGESNQLVVDDAAASRRHCVIRKEGGHFRIVDLDSRNGCSVNGLPLKEKLLEHGDEIRVGNSVFQFLNATESAGDSNQSVSLEPGLLTGTSTVILRSEDAVYLGRGAERNKSGTSPHAARDLAALLRITHALHESTDPDSIFQSLLEASFDIVPFDRGAVLLIGSNKNLTASHTANRERAEADPIKVNPDTIEKVMQDRVALVDAAAVDARQRPRWSMAVPLCCFDRAIGVLYLETGSAAAAALLDHWLLQLFMAVGAIAGQAIENGKRVEHLETENLRLRAEINLEHDMVGESPAIREVYRFIDKVASTDATVLIEGESGTGKELVARAIHRNSRRSAGPFAAINCAALTESLLESELFGHEKGAFTGAVALRKGRFEAAAGGTIFLDEIGELAPAMQSKLLRVLQEHEFERVGGTKPIRTDVRVVAATNRDLAAESKTGNFRQDLYFRLNVVSVRMPPLRERRQDIWPLAEHFMIRAAARSQRKISGISPQVRDRLVEYGWPGNIRELENAMERAVILGTGDLIVVDDLPKSLDSGAGTSDSAPRKLQDVVQEGKKQAILAALEQTGWNYTQAAKLLDVHPNYLHRLISQLNLKIAVKRRALEALE
jgi:transcriptional regulator with GAF, ATPase, and Fis domain